MTTFDLVIIGGGIIGLSIAMEAKRRHPRRSVLVVEKEDRVAAHQTGHNSGVIHSGLYYKPGSLKARTCVEGAAAMIAFCREHGLPHEICGKVVVATRDDELPALEELLRRGTANGVPDLAMIGPERLREIEPHSAGIRALHVPGTGIVDYVAVANAYASEVTKAGGEIRTGTRALRIMNRGTEIVVETTRGAAIGRRVINCAGLESDRLARTTGIKLNTMIVPFPGFWRMAARYWRSGLDEFHRSLSKRAFVRALQRLLPEIGEGDLRPGGAGVRAQALDRSGKFLDDFEIIRDGRDGGLVHVLNVPSPAATASLVIGRRIVDMIG